MTRARPSQSRARGQAVDQPSQTDDRQQGAGGIQREPAGRDDTLGHGYEGEQSGQDQRDVEEENRPP
jgi:hypothetical protein